MKQIERIRHCDLDSLEAIGPTMIYGALTRQAQSLYTSTAQIVIGIQSGIVAVFGLIYLGSVNIAALAAAVVILGFGVAMYLGRLKGAHDGLMQANQKENELFSSITDLLQGFKEVRLNLRRSADLVAFTSAISENVRDLRGASNVRFMELFLVGQLSFFAACAALVFLLPPFGLMAPEDLLKTVVAVLFLLGPVTGITSAVPASPMRASPAPHCSTSSIGSRRRGDRDRRSNDWTPFPKSSYGTLPIATAMRRSASAWVRSISNCTPARSCSFPAPTVRANRPCCGC